MTEKKSHEFDELEPLPELPVEAEPAESPAKAVSLPETELEEVSELPPMEPPELPPAEELPELAAHEEVPELPPAAEPPPEREPAEPAASAEPTPAPEPPVEAVPESAVASGEALLVEEPLTESTAAGESASDPSGKGARSRPQPGGGQTLRRDLERAPLELRKAAIVLMVGSIFPWGDPSNLAIGPIVEKLICFLAIWLFYQSHVLKYGGKANGLVAALGKSNVKVPMILAGIVALIGLAPTVSAGSASGFQIFTTVTEKAFLLLGGFTYVHIYDYEHGGKFNPMFPLMFLFPLIGGAMAIFTKILPVFSDSPGAAAVSLLGALIVAVAGLIASHTMYVAMKEAKAHGEAKRQAAAEARKSAREARKSQAGGGPAGGTGGASKPPTPPSAPGGSGGRRSSSRRRR